MKVIELLENNYYFKTACLCEPQLSPRGLIPICLLKLTMKDRISLEFLTYCDGNSSVLEISNRLGVAPWDSIINHF